MTFNPVDLVLDGYGKEITDSENGCSVWQIASDGAEGVSGLAALASIPLGVSGAAGAFRGIGAEVEGAGAATPAGAPLGVKGGWFPRVADNGKGTVWQDLESYGVGNGNQNSIRIADPTDQYPNGYVRFYNDQGQPIGLNGKPGSRSDTHVPIRSDGTYPIPEGWDQ